MRMISLRDLIRKLFGKKTTNHTGFNRDKFREQARRELTFQYQTGKITREKFARSRAALQNPRLVQRAIVAMEQDYGEINWNDIITWISNNWMQILSAILSLALMFLGDEELEKDELWQ